MTAQQEKPRVIIHNQTVYNGETHTIEPCMSRIFRENVVATTYKGSDDRGEIIGMKIEDRRRGKTTVIYIARAEGHVVVEADDRAFVAFGDGVPFELKRGRSFDHVPVFFVRGHSRIRTLFCSAARLAEAQAEEKQSFTRKRRLTLLLYQTAGDTTCHEHGTFGRDVFVDLKEAQIALRRNAKERLAHVEASLEDEMQEKQKLESLISRLEAEEITADPVTDDDPVENDYDDDLNDEDFE